MGQPHWVMPANASNALRDLAWSKELMEHVFRHVSPNNCEEKALTFLREIWEEVKTEKMWQKNEVDEQVKHYACRETMNTLLINTCSSVSTLRTHLTMDNDTSSALGPAAGPGLWPMWSNTRVLYWRVA